MSYDKWQYRDMRASDSNILAAIDFHDGIGYGDFVLRQVFGDGTVCVWISCYERANDIVVFADSTFNVELQADRDRIVYEVEIRVGITLANYGYDVAVVDQRGYEAGRELTQDAGHG